MRSHAVKVVIIAYDIADNALRMEIFNFLRKWGEPVQKSVFECRLTETELAQVKNWLDERGYAEQDSVMVYKLCEKCVSAIVNMGPRKLNMEEDWLIV